MLLRLEGRGWFSQPGEGGGRAGRGYAPRPSADSAETAPRIPADTGPGLPQIILIFLVKALRGPSADTRGYGRGKAADTYPAGSLSGRENRLGTVRVFSEVGR